MAASRRPPQPEIAHPFVWRPGDGVNAGCVQRMRARFPRPLKPMGDAWYMGEERCRFDVSAFQRYRVAAEPFLQFAGPMRASSA
ncbi:MAG: hypothetical protein ABW002_13255 [Xanthomonas sp.]